MLGTRGVPARYSGFETCVEEVGRRLVARGHEVTVYCRGSGPDRHLGMRLVHLPAPRLKVAETLVHTLFSVVHASRQRYDSVVLFNAANAVLLPLVRAPMAVHVDGLEWKRAKWGPVGKRWYLASERLAVRWADTLIADAAGISAYYRDRYGADTRLISYGAPIVGGPDPERLSSMGLSPAGFHLIVARFEPENNIDLMLEGYRRSSIGLPLVVVGDVFYRSAYAREVRARYSGVPGVRFVGGVWDQELLDSLYAGAATVLHGHSVGGTNPSLLRAMGAGATVLAFDVTFNREVLGDTGRFFSDPDGLAELLRSHAAGDLPALGDRARGRARERYVWDDVARAYEDLCREISA